MGVQAIVPQKALTTAKGRLSAVLSRAARAQLSLWLLESVCRALGAVDSVEAVTVMTPDPDVQRHAARWGVRATFDARPVSYTHLRAHET